MTFKKILLATDGTPEAAAAVDATISLARYGPAHVCVLHVSNQEPTPEEERLVQDTVDRLTNASVMAGKEVHRADHQNVAGVIAMVARESAADLVVVGSRGLSDWKSMLHHSVSHEVLALLDCPVLVVRGDRGHNAIGKMRRILVAVAGGDDVKPATDAAIAVAATVPAEAMVVHVAQAFFGPEGVAFIESSEAIDDCVEDAVRRLREARIPAEGRVLKAGPVATSIIEAATQWNADLIVVGSSRMRDLASLLLGSVSHQLLHNAELPVLIGERARD